MPQLLCDALQLPGVCGLFCCPEKIPAYPGEPAHLFAFHGCFCSSRNIPLPPFYLAPQTGSHSV